jgi:hypothetical protein
VDRTGGPAAFEGRQGDAIAGAQGTGRTDERAKFPGAQRGCGVKRYFSGAKALRRGTEAIRRSEPDLPPCVGSPKWSRRMAEASHHRLAKGVVAAPLAYH